MEPLTCFECSDCNVLFAGGASYNEHIAACDGHYRGELCTCSNYDLMFAESHVCDMHSPHCGQGEVANDGAASNDLDSTSALLEQMEQRYDAFKRMKPAQKRKHLDEAAAATGLTADVCRCRWNELLYSFKRMKDNASSRKTECGSVASWRYYEIMSRILTIRQ